jgi:hypothetical protein
MVRAVATTAAPAMRGAATAVVVATAAAVVTDQIACSAI